MHMADRQLIIYAVVGCSELFRHPYHYLHCRFVSKDRLALSNILYLFFSTKPKLDHSNRSKAQSVARYEAPPAIDRPAAPASITEKKPEPAAVPSEPPHPVPVIDKFLADTMSRLLTEFEQNYIIVKDFSGDHLLPLHTDVGLPTTPRAAGQADTG
jgi:hypothetical protein